MERTYELHDLKTYFAAFFDSETNLKMEIRHAYPRTKPLIELALANMEYSLAFDEDPEDLLGGGDCQDITYLISLLPYYILVEEYDQASEFAECVHVLFTNFASMYPFSQEILQPSLDALSRLLLTRASFTQLITVAHQLLSKYDHLQNNQPETLKVTQDFLQCLLKKEEASDESCAK